MPRFACGLILVFGLLISIVALPAVALGQTWDGLGADNNWTTVGNWSGGVPSNTNPGSANVIFAGATRPLPNVDTNNPWRILSLTFGNTATAFTIERSRHASVPVGHAFYSGA